MRWRLASLGLLMLAPVARAWGNEPGDFDYYLLALSWSPSWCQTTGDARDDPRCDRGSGLGFTLHGLWPQYEEGWPEFCDSGSPEAPTAETRAMEDIMGSAGLAAHQWRKHGQCTGLDPSHYFALSRQAFEAVNLPSDPPNRTTPAALEADLQARNPQLDPDAMIVTCRGDLALEVRICLTEDLGVRRCGADVLERACPASRPVQLPPPR